MLNLFYWAKMPQNPIFAGFCAFQSWAVVINLKIYYLQGVNINYPKTNGVYYRPSLVKAKWSDSTGSKSVKNLYVHLNNASYVYNMSTYQKYYSNIVNKMSIVSISNPGNGITYVGNVIDLPTNTAYSTFFNGIDAYAYVSGYVTDNSSKKYEFSFQLFDGSGLNPGM